MAAPTTRIDHAKVPLSDAQTYSSDVAFTPAVKAVQTRKGSRDAYARVEQNGGWRTEIDENLAAFLAETISFYFATASASGRRDAALVRDPVPDHPHNSSRAIHDDLHPSAGAAGHCPIDAQVL